MNRYLLDTNVCVYLLRGRQNIRRAIEKVGWANCYISEITVAELMYGAECSNHIKENLRVVEDLCRNINVIPISSCIREYARQKAILRGKGKIIEDSDIWIGVTAIVEAMTMVTENVRHLGRIEGINIVNWN